MKHSLDRLVLALVLSLGALPALAITIDEIKQNAESGDLSSQFQLGTLYWQGRAVAQDYSAAFKWFEKAAKRGVPEAQANIAVFYSNGWAVAQNYKKAVFWHKKAAAQGFALSQFQLGQFQRAGIGGLSKSDALALTWFKKAAKGENRNAQSFLGVYYIGEKKYKEARKWFEKAAELGDASSQFMFGQFLQKGIGGAKDLEEAASWFESAAANDVVEAQFELAGLFYQGAGGLEKDASRAFELYQQAAAANYLPAQFNIGAMYFDGIGTTKDTALGLEWLDKALVRGYVKAMLYLVNAYSKGKGVKQNYQRAYEYVLVVEGLELKSKKGKLKKSIRKIKKPIELALSKAQRRAAKMRAQELLAEIRVNQLQKTN